MQGYLQRSIATEIRRVKAVRRKTIRQKLFGDALQGFSLHHKMTKPEAAPPITQVTYEAKAVLTEKADNTIRVQCPATVMPGMVITVNERQQASQDTVQ